jgi:hypothetical protein
MKYILSLFLCFILFSIGSAQTVNFTGTDTVVNAGTKAINLTVSGSYNSGALQVIITKIDGTVAGNAIFQGSVDGVNYVNLDTLATSNVATQTKIFIQTPVLYPFYRVSYTGTGTMRAIISGKAHFKGKL